MWQDEDEDDHRYGGLVASVVFCLAFWVAVFWLARRLVGG